MNSLLKSFLAIMKELGSFEVTFTEDPSLFSISYSLPFSVVRKIADAYEGIFSNFDVSFELFYERKLDYNAFLQNAKFIATDDNLEFKLTLNKQVKLKLPENTVIFFKNKSFFKYFDALNIKFFEKINVGKNISIHLPLEHSYSNSFIRLHPIEESIIIPAEDLSPEAVEEFSLIKKIHDEVTRGGIYYPLPNYYQIDDLPDHLKSWFDQNLFHASLLYLANKLSDDKKVVLRGHKNAEITLCSDLKIRHAAILYQIFRFCYEEKHYNDKIEIARNIFTIYLNSTDTAEKIDELLPKIEKTISNHFSAYIQDSIKKFFNDRKDVVKEAHKFGSDLKAESDKLLTYINTSLIGVITAIFSGALGLSKGERWYLIVAFALHALLFIFSYVFNRNFVEKRKDEITSLYDKYTSKFVILAEDDLEDIKKIYIEPAVINVKSYLKLYKRVIIGLVAFMIILIVIGIWLPDSFFSVSSAGSKATPTAVTNNVYTNGP
ncbi:DUF2207 domain-containing protein [Paenibacillus cremeus]|uniref:DUF2207 domain-containing protein n=1 Tax=Paenibacillus cremeus TaxID=2163881 RepID=A0A559KAE4_9BACL|nr:DUF2207 domain-containing protein [Paenibacillus cremeus]TVY09069.1 DUF2207 domain-containing protein [Paenibacillus cremeus]